VEMVLRFMVQRRISSAPSSSVAAVAAKGGLLGRASAAYNYCRGRPVLRCYWRATRPGYDAKCRTKYEAPVITISESRQVRSLGGQYGAALLESGNRSPHRSEHSMLTCYFSLSLSLSLSLRLSLLLSACRSSLPTFPITHCVW
jgi:hypothetical protein